MGEYDRIMNSLSVALQQASCTYIKEPFALKNYYEIENTFIYVNKGALYFGKKKQIVKAGEILFIPGGKTVALDFLSENPERTFEYTDYRERDDLQFIEKISKHEDKKATILSFCIDAKVFNAVNLFLSLDISPFVVRDKILVQLLKDIYYEFSHNEIGRTQVINSKSREVVTKLFRYIILHRLFVQQMTTNVNNLQDDRLIVLFKYINENLARDLSNRRLAEVARISEDYIGQYFKTLIGINPQDYVEFQRMQKAIVLLRKSVKSIREIGREVGYKDSSYFCRRFKMMFGISAGRMRRREPLAATEK